MKLSDKIKSVCENTETEAPMRGLTSFRIGGNAEILTEPSSAEQINEIVNICRSEGASYTVIGNGSNILVSDEGIDGVVIRIGRRMSACQISGDILFAESGALLSGAANAAAEAGLSGMEFASGIPGSLGGAVCMNAGAYGGEMKDIVKSVTFVQNGEIMTLPSEELDFSYRHSIFSGGDKIIISCELRLKEGKTAEIRAAMKELNGRRAEKQPLTLPSAGSAFKRPEGYFAAKLIEDSGLKGFRCGDAAVSEKHSGFIVNLGNATAKEVSELIEHIQKTVFEKFGVMLEPEIKKIGRW